MQLLKFHKVIIAFIVLILFGCESETASKEEKENGDGRSFFKEAEEADLLEDELIEHGFALYDPVDKIEELFGEPSDVTEELTGGYTYEYEDRGLGFSFDSSSDELKAVVVNENSSLKTAKGVGNEDDFDTIRHEYMTYDPYLFEQMGIIILGENTVLSFTFNEENRAIAYILADKAYFELIAEMPIEDFIEEVRMMAESQQLPPSLPETSDTEVAGDVVTNSETDTSVPVENAESEAALDMSPADDQLLYAIWNGDTGAVKRTLDEHDYDLNRLFSTNINQSPYFKTTFIHEAAQYGNVEMVKAMIAHGADPATVNPDGEPVLHVAIQQNKTDTALYLLEIGADPGYLVWDQSERAMSYSYTPIMLAAQNGNLKLMEELVALGVDVNQQSIIGETALWSAVYFNQLEAAKFLLYHGADPLIEDNTYHYKVWDMPFAEWGINDVMVNWLEQLKSTY